MSTSITSSVGQNIVAQDNQAKIPRLKERISHELVIALVGPIGSGCTETYKLLKKILEDDYGYAAHYHKLSDIIKQSASLVDSNPQSELRGAERVQYYQSMGDKLRKTFGKNYLAAKAIEKIAQVRDHEGKQKTVGGEVVFSNLRKVHIVDSLKHPEELHLLRSTYGEIFWLIGVFAPLEIRKKRLKLQQGISENEVGGLVQRDYTEEDEHGQNVRSVFHQSDYFVRNGGENTASLEKTLKRFVDIIFGHPVHTPTVDESSMYAAHAEAAKSACLSRQVGAAIVSAGGELIGLGRNDVPRFQGGLYTEDDGENDHRCFAWGGKQCHNDRKKEALYDQIYTRLSNARLLADSATQEKVTKELKSTDVKQLIEYSRAVHAEMDAITSVARMHKAGIVGGTLYSTTFPCHSCARHIVASGIKTVFFIEPYPKSLATELHNDAISEAESDAGKKVLFLQYSGIAPKNILKLFNAGLTRKGRDGKLVVFDKKHAPPVVPVSLDDYPTHEKLVVAELAENEQKAKQEQSAPPNLFGV